MEPDFPMSYKVAKFGAKNEPLTIAHMPLNYPNHGEILVKVLACGICHSDLILSEGTLGNTFPTVPGHEIVGDVVCLGPGEKSFKIGDRVGGLWHGGHDGTCKQCKRGDFQVCEHAELNGVTRMGGYAEYCILRMEAVARLPHDIDPAEAAPLLCAGLMTFNGIRKTGIIAGDVVAVQGLGGLGHLAVQFASKMGYKTVAISRRGAKEMFARELGAHHFINSSRHDIATSLKQHGGAALIVLTASNPRFVEPLMRGLAPRGKLLILSPIGEFTADSGLMIREALSITGSTPGNASDGEETVDFAKTHGIQCMVEKYRFEDVNSAIDDMLHGRVRFRAVLVME
ncbi:hypothetical protein AJ80_05908 [Polytolypa hystricis UAMH7299]|uniref:Enoyl reductase (ER) domain-containing protein n=1 Tax=Polytolypa hystricis (strain UAMH7299) TaxID=1447883 RepID=A0A2B7Y0A5_POLH7|nr:hypothetical protein AJ80_05908 [Polytolypa hystricis UAMH7299]